MRSLADLAIRFDDTDGRYRLSIVPSSTADCKVSTDAVPTDHSGILDQDGLSPAVQVEHADKVNLTDLYVLSRIRPYEQLEPILLLLSDWSL